MRRAIKNLGKHIYYAMRRSPRLDDYRVTLSYIFHTEHLFDDAVWRRLIGFCDSYRALTGARPICTAMSGANAMVAGECARRGIADGLLAERIALLSEKATLGYHGHFYTERAAWADPRSFIKDANFSADVVAAQMDADIAWFKRRGLDTNRLYAAGWWFQNPSVLAMLSERGFEVDFSFSWAPWFGNDFSRGVMRQNRIAAGQPFRSAGLLCIQNLIGCHQTPFPQDFVRNLRAILGEHPRDVIGVVNSHDYDLAPAATLACIEYLMRRDDVQFVDSTRLIAMAEQHAGPATLGRRIPERSA